MRKKILIGLGFGLLGIFVEFSMWYASGEKQIFGIRDAFVIVPTFFFGVTSGLASLCALDVWRMAFAIYEGDVIMGVIGAATTALSFCFAFLISKMIYQEKRPPVLAAALFGFISVLSQPLVHIILATCGIVSEVNVIVLSVILNGSLTILLAVILSFVLRVPQSVKFNLTSAFAILLLGGIILGFAFAQHRAAVEHATDRAQALRQDAITTLEYPMEPEMLHVARVQTVKYGTIDKFIEANVCSTLAQDNDYDLVAAVGTNGCIMASSRPELVGFDLASDEFTREYLELNHGLSYMTNPFRTQVPALSDGSSKWCKYIGMAFPSGGFVFIAESLTNLAYRDYLLRETMFDWHVDVSGSFVLVNPNTGIILSALEEENIGKTVQESGIADLKFKKPGDLSRGKVFGIDTFVHLEHIKFVDLDVYMLMPARDVLASRDVSVVVFLVVVFLAYGGASLLIAKIMKQGRDLTVLRAKEDEARARDLHLAQEIQLSALPSMFKPFGDCTDFSLYALMRTAKEVGGDFYDFYSVGPRKLCLVMADVSGKGIPAALFMMKAKAVIRAEMLRSSDDLSAAMEAANNTLYDNNVAEMFVTVWLGVYDLDTGVLESVCAGHNPPIIRRADGTTEWVSNRRGLVMGGLPGIRYQKSSVTLNVGDSLYLYTDGVTEATNAEGGFFGDDRLKETIATCDQGPKETCERVLASVNTFAGSAPQADDITMLALARR